MKILLLFALTLMMVGCAMSYCRGRTDGSEKNIFVYKPDGSKQCQKGSGTSLELMSEELKGVNIYSQESSTDGMMHVMVCGAETGQINVFEIKAKDLEKVKAKGYLVLEK